MLFLDDIGSRGSEITEALLHLSMYSPILSSNKNNNPSLSCGKSVLFELIQQGAQEKVRCADEGVQKQ